MKRLVTTAMIAALLCSFAASAGTLTTNGGNTVDYADLSYCVEDEDAPVVYFTSDISPEALVKIYEAMEWQGKPPVAVKLSTGEPPKSNYLRPELIADLVDEVDGTIVECNTAYAGQRAATAEHYQVAEDHGYTDIAEFQVMDEYDSMEIPVTGGDRLTGNLVGAHFADYGSFIVLSHFKGHAMAGYGGAIKNASIGLASARGKVRIHSGGTSDTHWNDDLQTEFLECMAEAAKSVKDYLGDLYDEFDELRSDKETFISALELYEPIPLNIPEKNIGDIITFETTDFDGNTITSEEIFKNHKVTMINLWATWCGPCKRELPDLSEMAREFEGKDCQIIGICLDANNETAIGTAKDILSECGCDYLNIAPPEDINDILPAASIPTSYFVDSEGRIIAEKVVGARVDLYPETIDECLAAME